MEKQFYDEKHGMWYELHGEYYLPCLTVRPKNNVPSAFGDSGICSISGSTVRRSIPGCYLTGS